MLPLPEKNGTGFGREPNGLRKLIQNDFKITLKQKRLYNAVKSFVLLPLPEKNGTGFGREPNGLVKINSK